MNTADVFHPLDQPDFGGPEACTGVANPNQAPRDHVACHGSVHVATF